MELSQQWIFRESAQKSWDHRTRNTVNFLFLVYFAVHSDFSCVPYHMQAIVRSVYLWENKKLVGTQHNFKRLLRNDCKSLLGKLARHIIFKKWWHNFIKRIFLFLEKVGRKPAEAQNKKDDIFRNDTFSYGGFHAAVHFFEQQLNYNTRTEKSYFSPKSVFLNSN